MAAYFIREQAFGPKERTYHVVVVTSKGVSSGNIEIVISAPFLGQPGETIWHDLTGGGDGASTVTKIEQNRHLVQVNIGRAESGEALVALISELAGDAVTFIEQVTSYGGLVGASGHYGRCSRTSDQVQGKKLSW